MIYQTHLSRPANANPNPTPPTKNQNSSVIHYKSDPYQ